MKKIEAIVCQFDEFIDILTNIEDEALSEVVKVWTEYLAEGGINEQKK